MSSSESIEVSKAVADQLSDASAAGIIGGFSFIARHSMLPIITRESCQVMRVDTRPRGDIRTFASRSRTQHDYQIEIAIRKIVTGEDTLIAEELVLAAEKIADYWERTDATTNQTRALTGRDEKLTSPVEMQFSEEAIQQHRIILATVILNFRGWR